MFSPYATVGTRAASLVHMLRTHFGIAIAALALISSGLVAACGNSKPASDASEIDRGSGESPQTEDAGAGSPGPADANGVPNDPALPGSPGGVPDSTPKPGGGSAPGPGAGPG